MRRERLQSDDSFLKTHRAASTHAEPAIPKTSLSSLFIVPVVVFGRVNFPGFNLELSFQDFLRKPGAFVMEAIRPYKVGDEWRYIFVAEGY